MLSHLQTDPVAPARVVVLGSSGFVGRHLRSRLEARRVPAAAFSSRDLDLADARAGERLASLLHRDDALVFVSALTPDRGKDVRTLMTNLRMGEQVCAALAASPCAHVVYISSDAVYDEGGEPVSEGTCASPASFHGLMHLARERMLAATLPGTTPLAVLRPSLLYGAGDTHNGYGPNRFLRTARAERTIALFGEGEERRDHVFVEDLIELIDRVLGRRSAGVLNVATGRSRSFAEVARAVARLVPETRVESKPRSGAVTHRTFDVRAVDEAFPGFRFTALEDGLARA